MNRSRTERIRGYSPCHACCDDLAHFLRVLKAAPGSRRIDASISWLGRYTGSAVCGHTTDSRGIAMLRAAGWTLPNPLPVAVREIASRPEEFLSAP